MVAEERKDELTMPKSPREMLAAIVRGMPSRTGRTVKQWVRLLESKGPTGYQERIAWLKKGHALGGPTAMVIAAAAEGRDLVAPYENGEGLVAAQYSGAKAKLEPIHAAAVKAARALGKDVTVSPRKTYVTLSRNRQFAVVQPSTRSRVDLGLVLPGVKPTGRLKAAKNVGGGRITHAIALARPSDIDAEARRWLRTAYRADAG